MPIIPFKIPVYKIPPADGKEGKKIPKGEKEIFEKAQESHLFDSEDKYFIYSVRFMEAGRQIEGEVDYIYLDNESLFFLECKGGLVRYSSRESKWYTQGGKVDKDPFEQVCSYLLDFREKKLRALPDANGIKRNLIIGYGVMFPGCVKPAEFTHSYNKPHFLYGYESVEYALEVVYDSTDHSDKNGFRNYINRLKEYWRQHGYNKNKPLSNIDKDQQLAIVNLLKQDIIFEIPILEYFNKDELETKKYTEQQFEVIQFLLDNQGFPYIINGGPGTGKTLMALEYAKHLNKLGKKVLLLCYNRPLAIKLQSDMKNILKSAGLNENMTDIVNVHRFMVNKLEICGQKINIEQSDDFWFNKLPRQFSNYFSENPDPNKYDYLIIDEGQDLFYETVFDALDFVLSGGWRNCNWAVFIDKYYQSVYGDFNRAYFNYFKEIYKAFEFKLNKNCRNTPSIIDKAHFHTGAESTDCLKSDSFKPELEFYSSDIDFLIKLNKKVTAYADKGIPFDDFTVLVPSGIIDTVIASSPKRYEKLGDNVSIRNGKIKVASPSLFKGLENRIVILGGYNNYNPEDKKLMSELYVAYTRATSLLIILFSEAQKGKLQKFIDKQIFHN